MKEKQRARESFERTVLGSRFIMWMNSVTHQGTFFQQQVFFFFVFLPLVDMLKDHTYIFNEVTDNHRKPEATAGGSELPRDNLISQPHIGKTVWER